MGKESIYFLIVWITLGNIFATFSSASEPTNTTEFGKNDLKCYFPHCTASVCFS